MKLNLSQIKDISLGAVRIEEDENGFNFYRFTKEQEETYKNLKDNFYAKTFATSGVKLRFKTNSKRLFFKVKITSAGVRGYFSFDVFVNGKRVDTIDNFSNMQLPNNYASLPYKYDEHSKEFNLGEGEKEVSIYFPWSVKATLKTIEFDDDSYITSVKPSKKIIFYGDSITQGVDALHPSCKYATLIADMLDAEEYNKAISGEIFFPELAALKDDINPDYVVISYGANDWYRSTQEEFSINCRSFFKNVISNYSNAKIFDITPIWNKLLYEERPFGDFRDVDKIIKNIAKDFPEITVFDGFDFVPHDVSYYGDLRLHPNDEGFRLYFENLAKQLKGII